MSTELVLLSKMAFVALLTSGVSITDMRLGVSKEVLSHSYDKISRLESGILSEGLNPGDPQWLNWLVNGHLDKLLGSDPALSRVYKNDEDYCTTSMIRDSGALLPLNLTLLRYTDMVKRSGHLRDSLSVLNFYFSTFYNRNKYSNLVDDNSLGVIALKWLNPHSNRLGSAEVIQYSTLVLSGLPSLLSLSNYSDSESNIKHIHNVLWVNGKTFKLTASDLINLTMQNNTHDNMFLDNLKLIENQDKPSFYRLNDKSLQLLVELDYINGGVKKTVYTYIGLPQLSADYPINDSDIQ